MNHISDQDLAVAYRERFSVPEGEIISSSEMAAKHVTAFLGDGITEREKFVVLLLNGRNQLVRTEVLFEGTLTSSVVYPREIARLALQHNVAAIIVGHNHPSGNMNASEADCNITTKIKEALKTVEISFLDHVIVVPGGSHYSFADAGLI